MPKPRVRVTINQRALGQVAHQVAKRVQPDANEAAHNAVRRVRDRGGDRSVDQVYEELVQELVDVFGADRFAPEEAVLRHHAQAIVAGRLED